MPVTSKTYALYKCARMILDDQCPPEREHYLCMKQEDDTGACTQCWDNYLWGLFTETIEPHEVKRDIVGRCSV